MRNRGLVGLVLWLGMAISSNAVDLIGYVPDYRMSSSYVNNTLPGQLAMLDEVRYFGISVNASGSLTTTPADLSNIQAIRSIIDSMPVATRPRLDITIGGDGQSSGFSAVAANASLRTQFAQNISSLLTQTGATAVDIDWEHPAAGAERTTLYPAMLGRIKQELGPTRRVYATVDPTVMVSNSIFSGANAIDGVSLMTYDLGWWSNDPSNPHEGEHSLHEYVQDSVQAWTDAPGSPNPRPWVFGAWGNDAPSDKIGVGLPLYGRGFNGSSQDLAVTYRDLFVNGTSTDGNAYVYQGSQVWIPGLDMVRQRMALAEASGLQHVILWELGQDLAPNHTASMLRVAFGPRGDFNGDSRWDCGDIDALTQAIAAASSNPAFDMNGDGAITLADIMDAQVGWLAKGGANNPAATGGNSFRPGDANLDGDVDGSDFNLWNSSKFTSNSAWCSGDFNADGAVDGSDFSVWNSHKFTSSDSLSVIPEPMSGAWLVLLGACGLHRTRHVSFRASSAW